MNIFLPYKDDIEASVKSLDDVRLNKQILECFAMCEAILQQKTKGYINHIVTQFYKNNVNFIGYYGHECCQEYFFRHEKESFFSEYFINFALIRNIKFTPFYAEFSRNDPKCIRTTENVSTLFQEKLCKKWDNDKRTPKWTKREVPKFYEERVKGERE